MQISIFAPIHTDNYSLDMAAEYGDIRSFITSDKRIIEYYLHTQTEIKPDLKIVLDKIKAESSSKDGDYKLAILENLRKMVRSNRNNLKYSSRNHDNFSEFEYNVKELPKIIDTIEMLI